MYTERIQNTYNLSISAKLAGVDMRVLQCKYLNNCTKDIFLELRMGLKKQLMHKFFNRLKINVYLPP